MIIFKNVTKKYPPNVNALNGVNFHIQPKEFVSVVGQSGSGKTTIIKLAIAEEKADKGNIIIGGWDITNIKQRDIPNLRRQIGVVFQDFKLLPKKTVYENVAFGLEVCGKPASVLRLPPTPAALKTLWQRQARLRPGLNYHVVHIPTTADVTASVGVKV